MFCVYVFVFKCKKERRRSWNVALSLPPLHLIVNWMKSIDFVSGSTKHVCDKSVKGIFFLTAKYIILCHYNAVLRHPALLQAEWTPCTVMIIILSQGQTNGSRAPAICNSHPGMTVVSSGKNEDDKWIQEHTTQRKILHTKGIIKFWLFWGHWLCCCRV